MNDDDTVHEADPTKHDPDNRPTGNDSAGGEAPTPMPEPPSDPDASPTDPDLLASEHAADSNEVMTKGISTAKLVTIAGALSLVGLLAIYFVIAAPAQNRVELLESQLAAANIDVEELDGEVDELTVKLEKLQSEVTRLDSQNAELSTEAAIAEQAIEAMRSTQNELEVRLKDQIQKGSVLIEERDGELVVDLIDKIVFDSGEAELNDSGKDVLKEVGETLNKVPDKVIMIAGHTDNLPISDKLVEQFPTNWELSTARSTNVVRFLQEEIKIPGKRLAVAGFAEFRPVAKNRSSAGRRKNRRIEVRLLPIR